MRSLLVVAVLSAALYPVSSLRAEQAAPVVSAPAAPNGTATDAAPVESLTRLTVLDDDGTLRTMLCRPLSVEKTTPRRVAPAPVTRALPASPAQAPVPDAASRQTASQPCLPPPRPTDLGIRPNAPLYADPAAVEAAWNCYAPRRTAYAPRAWRAPDPAVHSPLPPLRSTVRRSAGPSAPSKTPVQIGIDVLVSTVQTLCPPAAGSAVSAAADGDVSPAAMPVPRVGSAAAPASTSTTASAASRDVYGGPAPNVPNAPVGR